ncbi:MAG: hypothetical protein KAY24_00735, partial [Candidatus Eisenbacteria sp.]|nr:hypothetical protein [Candidatus Eisenbacteria bacterium]
LALGDQVKAKNERRQRDITAVTAAKEEEKENGGREMGVTGRSQRTRTARRAKEKTGGEDREKNQSARRGALEGKIA